MQKVQNCSNYVNSTAMFEQVSRIFVVYSIQRGTKQVPNNITMPKWYICDFCGIHKKWFCEFHKF